MFPIYIFFILSLFFFLKKNIIFFCRSSQENDRCCWIAPVTSALDCKGGFCLEVRHSSSPLYNFPFTFLDSVATPHQFRVLYCIHEALFHQSLCFPTALTSLFIAVARLQITDLDMFEQGIGTHAPSRRKIQYSTQSRRGFEQAGFPHGSAHISGYCPFWILWAIKLCILWNKF